MLIDRWNFHLEIISLFEHMFSLIVKSPTIKVFDHFSIVNMERLGSDSLSENHSVWALELQSNMMKIIEDGVMQGLSCLQNSTFGLSNPRTTCIEECLTEYI